MTHTAAMCMLVLVVGVMIWRKDRAEKSCLYCGVYNGHAPKCPYSQLYKD